MSLVCEFELSFHVENSLLVLFNAPFSFSIVIFSSFLGRFDFLKQIIVSNEQFLSIDLANFTQWNVWNLMFKSSMNVHTVI
jgi:hypothetical protein